jgi:hypothetical protein
MLVDSGESLDLSDTHDKLDNGGLFNWLKFKFGDRLDISLYSQEELNSIEEFFGSLSNVVDEERKMGISKNGLCLLVAYCFEGIQQNPIKL